MQTDISPLSAFKRYQDILPRLPKAGFPAQTCSLYNLSDLQDQFDAFVFDAYGVLNVGNTPIKGAAEFISHLRQSAKKVVVLTNSASMTHDQLHVRFSKLGFDFSAGEIVTSRDIIITAFNDYDPAMQWGVVSGHHAGIDELPCQARYIDEISIDACDGFILLNSSEWNDDWQNTLVDALKDRPRPVLVGNPDLVALHEHGFTYQPGFFAHDIWDRTAVVPRFFGKPYANAFELVCQRLGNSIANTRILMIGDTLHTDILGGAAAGFRTALMLGHGVLQGMDADACIQESGIVPDYVLASGYP